MTTALTKFIICKYSLFGDSKVILTDLNCKYIFFKCICFNNASHVSKQKATKFMFSSTRSNGIHSLCLSRKTKMAIFSWSFPQCTSKAVFFSNIVYHAITNLWTVPFSYPGCVDNRGRARNWQMLGSPVWWNRSKVSIVGYQWGIHFFNSRSNFPLTDLSTFSERYFHKYS